MRENNNPIGSNAKAAGATLKLSIVILLLVSIWGFASQRMGPQGNVETTTTKAITISRQFNTTSTATLFVTVPIVAISDTTKTTVVTLTPPSASSTSDHQIDSSISASVATIMRTVTVTSVNTSVDTRTTSSSTTSSSQYDSTRESTTTSSYFSTSTSLGSLSTRPGNGYFVPQAILQLDNGSFQNLVQNMIDSKIVYLFFQLPTVQNDGYLDPSSYSSVFSSLIERFKSYVGNSYSFEYIGWTTDQTNPMGLLSGYQQSSIAQTVLGLKNAGFTGIIVDPEPVPDGNTQFLSMLDAFRSAINNTSPGMLLGDAGMNIVPGASYGQEWAWDTTYYWEVTSKLDFVLPMLYESGANTSQDYMQWVEQRIQLNSIYSNSPVIYSLPNWYENTTWHHPWAENLQNSIYAFQDYMQNVGTSFPRPSNMLGVAIYALNGTYAQGNWSPIDSVETSPSDWAFFQAQWVDTPYPSEI